MSFIGATGYNENQEELDILKDNIDATNDYINKLYGIPDPSHTAIFGINILNPNLFGLVERAEVNIKALQLGEEGITTNIEGIDTTISGIETEITGIQTEITGIQTEITGIQTEITGIESSITAIQFVELPAIGVSIGLVSGVANDALSKANKSLGIWDESGNNVYHKKSGNVGIGTTFGSVLNNKLEVNGNINIPTGSTFRINNEPFNYTHLAGTQPVSSKWTNATDTATNIYYNTGNVGIGTISGINNKLEIGGNLNISANSKYKINNVNLAFSDLEGTLSYNSLSDKPTLFDGNYNSLTNKLTQGTNISIVGNVINNTYSLPTAGIGAGGTLGGVRVDNSTIFINGSGIISSAGGSPQVNSDWTETNTSLKSFILNKPNAGTNISFAGNTITNTIIGSPTQNIVSLNNNELIIKDKPNSQKVDNVDIPLTSGNEPYISSPAFTESIRTFTHSGGTEAQTSYTITLGQNTICDILVVGGGGGGGRRAGGGGGAGALIYHKNQILNGTYNIKVGKGGSGVSFIEANAINNGRTNSDQSGYNGEDSQFIKSDNTKEYLAKGGAGGQGGYGALNSTGGSAGGRGFAMLTISNPTSLLTPHNKFNNSIVNIVNNSTYDNTGLTYPEGCYGNLSGDQIENYKGGGGGGAGGVGQNHGFQGTANAGYGGLGLAIDITGTSVVYAGGGGGSDFSDSVSQVFDPAYPTIQSRGGGGFGSDNGIPQNGLDGTGGGGGGQGNDTQTSGKGGSGIVIIKFKTIVNSAIPEGNPITHKTLNFVYVPPPITYDFTNYNTEATWKAYASTIPNFTYSLTDFISSFDPDAVWSGNYVVGWVQMTLPSGYNFLTITYGLGTWTTGADNIVRLLINGVQKSSATLNDRTKTYSQAYNVGDVVRIEETFSTMSANFIFQFTNTNYITNTYTLSVQSGTSIQVNNQPAQYLSGNYTINVGATQSSVLISGFSPLGQTDPYPLTNGSTIAIRYSMLQRITSTINYKKDGLIKYVPASGIDPATGTWQILDIDTQPLSQFAGNLPLNRITEVVNGTLPISLTSGNLPANRLDNIDMSKVATGQLPINRTDGNLPANRLDNIDMSKVATGQLNQSRINDFYLGVNNRFFQINYAYENVISTGGVWTNKFRISTNLHLNSYGAAYNFYQYYLSLSPNNVADRHKYWFGIVKMTNLVGTDPAPEDRFYNLLSNSPATFDIRPTNSSSGVWWLNIWLYTTSFCESLVVILH
jgi:hypothetical protein